MLMPPDITFRGIPHSRTLEAAVVERLSWLERFYAGIVSCRVLIDAPDRHRRDGCHFRVTIELTVPHGNPIVINHAPSLHAWLKDAGDAAHLKQSETDSVHRYRHAAVHDAFDRAQRQLHDFARRQRGDVKRHEIPA